MNHPTRLFSDAAVRVCNGATPPNSALSSMDAPCIASGSDKFGR
jgi:hypothetical protein